MNKKRVGALLLGGMMAVSMVGCGQTDPGDVETPNPPGNSDVIDDDVTPNIDDVVNEDTEKNEDDTEKNEQEVDVEILPIDYVNDVYGYTVTYPGSWADRVDVNDSNPTVVDFCVKGTTVPFMSIISSFEESTDENAELLFTHNGWYYYKVLASECTDDSVKDDWEALKSEAAELSEDAFKFAADEVVENENTDENLTPLGSVIYNNRNAEDNEYVDIMTPANDDGFILEYLGLNDVPVDDWAISMSMMNVKAYGIMLVKPAEGQMDAVMEKLQAWVDNTKASFEQYLADQYEIASNAVCKTIGDYAVVVMCEDSETVASAIETALENGVETTAVGDPVAPVVAEDVELVIDTEDIEKAPVEPVENAETME